MTTKNRAITASMQEHPSMNTLTDSNTTREFECYMNNVRHPIYEHSLASAPDAPDISRLLRHIATIPSRIMLSRHAEKRMRERRISTTGIADALVHGTITEGPSRDTGSDWKVAIDDRSGQEYVGIVAALVLQDSEEEDYILILTVKN
jgi:hypothetical protein